MTTRQNTLNTLRDVRTTINNGNDSVYCYEDILANADMQERQNKNLLVQVKRQKRQEKQNRVEARRQRGNA